MSIWDDIEDAAGDAQDWVDEQWDDFTGVTAAEDQAEAIGEAAAEDRAYAHPNVYGPLGSQDVTRNPDGTVTINTALSGQQQALLDSLYGDLGTGRKSVEDALYAKATARLDPQFDRREEALRGRLVNQGLTEGDEAYRRAMQDLGFERTDAYGQAMNTATAAGGQEQSRLINALMASAQPGLRSYYGENNATNAAVAQGNLMSGTTSGLDAALGIINAIYG